MDLQVGSIALSRKVLFVQINARAVVVVISSRRDSNLNVGGASAAVEEEDWIKAKK